MVNSGKMAEDDKNTYYNEFFEGHPNLPKDELKKWLEEERRKKRVFAEYPTVNNLTRRDIWLDRAKFYFLPFFINCYKFTRQNKLPHFAIPVSPTCMFHRDRLHLRNFMDTIHQTFFKCMEMCIPKGESIMLLVEKRFHVENPIDGGTQQLYNMLWDVDLSPVAKSVLLPPPEIGRSSPRLSSSSGTGQDIAPDKGWDWDDLNPDVPLDGVELCRRTLWLTDDLEFLCKRFKLCGQWHSKEILDLSKHPEEKRYLYAKTARDFYFEVFEPIEDEDSDAPSSDSDLDPDDWDDDEDEDSTTTNMLDSTLDFQKDEEDMNKIIAFFANRPKVTNLVQSMLDMMGALTRILPLVAMKIDDPKLKSALTRTIEMLSTGIGRVLKICAFLGIKVQRKQGDAIGEIVKNRFKKDKKDFLEYEIDELNKYLDSLENVDEEPTKPPKDGKIPLDVRPCDLYPQRMPLRPPHPGDGKPPIVVPPEKDPPPPPPPKPPVKPEAPKPIPSVKPPPPAKPKKGEHGVK